jgi:hypothetical protein
MRLGRNVNRRGGAALPKITMVTGHTSTWTTQLILTSDVNDLTVDWGDGTAIEPITQNVAKIHNYTAGADKTIIIYTNSTKITKFQSNNSRIKSIDLSNILVQIAATFDCSNNAGLTSLIFKNDNNTIAGTFNLFSCNLTTLNLSYVTISTSTFQVYSNTLLSSIVFKNAANTISGTFNASPSAITTLDFSYVTVTTTAMYIGIPTLTNIIFKNAANTISGDFRVNTAGITTLDFSYVTLNLSTFYFYACPNLTSIIFKNAANVLSGIFRGYSCKLNNGLDSSYINWSNGVAIQLENNAMTAAGVNLSLHTRNLDSATGGSFVINGTNAAPDTTSGGYDGVAAKLALQGKGVTVTTN